ncbi:hypothetical protein [Pyxidicoccus xibeiensis]|uniref:hypothetical protein n=1 Tax=Pyxidicoccus xibeiensis TaxID=2906759 RepID=UPI0020A7828B|nr:hypothetical protein [Pyxidicoccus xibeiensis]MCP3136916.1 hypothetical protein [Pyxidicoccus xibeiensis]
MSARIAPSPDDTDWRLAPAVPGLLLDVPFVGCWRQRPSLHVEAAAYARLRLTSGGQPLLWSRIDSGWEECGFLRGPAPMPWRLPSITAPEVRDVRPAPATAEWYTAWSHRFVRELERAEDSLLHSGRWCLRPLLPVPADKAARYPCIPSAHGGDTPGAPHSLEKALRFEPFWTEAWDWMGDERPEVRSGAVLSLRAPSPESDGRVKAWRKHARDGTLPPVLLLYVQLVGKWLVVDGHDRLHAALLEGLAPPLLGLWPVLERPVMHGGQRRESATIGAEARLRARQGPKDIDAANQTLLRGFETYHRVAITRAWWLTGGYKTWRREVLAAREQRPFPADPDEWEWFAGAR